MLAQGFPLTLLPVVVTEDTVVEVMETMVTTTMETTTTKEMVVVVATKVMVVVVVAIRAIVVAVAITTEISNKTIVHVTMDLHVRFAPSLVILQVNASKVQHNFFYT
jgi:hypothetical protein